jgi:CRISPR/Cas system endoribonuclease Cas6 (RAMP superfamily)
VYLKSRRARLSKAEEIRFIPVEIAVIDFLKNWPLAEKDELYFECISPIFIKTLGCVKHFFKPSR